MDELKQTPHTLQTQHAPIRVAIDLRVPPDDPGVVDRGLRAALKLLLRSFGIRALSVAIGPVPSAAPAAPPAAGAAPPAPGVSAAPAAPAAPQGAAGAAPAAPRRRRRRAASEVAP